MSAEQVGSGRPKGMKVRMANGEQTPEVRAGRSLADRCLCGFRLINESVSQNQQRIFL